jgi:hypothetical protein
MFADRYHLVNEWNEMNHANVVELFYVTSPPLGAYATVATRL